MGQQKNPQTSLTEDFDSIGINYDPTEQAVIGGAPIPLTAKPAEEPIDENSVPVDDDPLDGPVVTMELFDRIMALPYENLSEDEVQEVLDALKEKELPEDANDELKARAEEVVDHLLNEVRPNRIRGRKHKKAARVRKKICPQGYRKESKDGPCKRAVLTVKGGAGTLHKQAKVKKIQSHHGIQKVGQKRGKRLDRQAYGAGGRPARRMHADVNVSPFAAELGSLLEGDKQVDMDVRDEIIERIDNIFILLHGEFLDESVSAVFTEAFEPVVDSFLAGRLDEDVVEADEFLASLKPVLSLITKSLDRIDRQDTGELGNE